ncbi:MAG: response regulator [Cyanobacteria bacterium P01_D01_bin.36]
MEYDTSAAASTVSHNVNSTAPLSVSLSTPTSENRPKVLVVDDLLENLRLLANLLIEDGYEVKRSPDGAMALSNVPRFQPDIILLDIMMPEMDGYAVCQQLKADPKTRDIPVIFLSALDLTFDKVKAFEVGAADYIHKPFHPAEVLARVKNQVRIRQQGLQLQAQTEMIKVQQQQIEEISTARKVAEDKLATIQSSL